MTRRRLRAECAGATAVAIVLEVLIVSFLASQPTLAATISHLQSTIVTSSSSATSLSRAFTSPNTAGSLIVAAVSFDSSGGTVWSCSDSQGNTYSNAIFRNDTRHDQALGICYAANIKAGSNTITVTYGGVSHAWRSLAIHEYSGVAAVSPLDKVSGNSGTSAAVTSLAVVPAESGELIFSAVGVDDGSTPTITAGTGFTRRQSIPDLTSEDRVQATAASIAGTFTLNASHDYIAILATFKTGPPGDTTPPSVPTGLATSSVSASQITFSWAASTDDIGVAGYQAYRNGVQVGTITSGTSYSDTNLTPNTSYAYTVSAYDTANNYSAQSAVLSAATVADTTPPTVSILSPVNNANVSGAIAITTTNVSDDVGIGGVRFQVDGTDLAAEDTTAPFSAALNTATLSYGIHVLTAIARDTSNHSTTAAPVNIIVYIDTTPPSVPGNLQASNITSGAATISWTAATDDWAVAGYQILRNGTPIGTTAATSYLDTGLTTNTTYSYAVSAYDRSNNVSAPSAPLIVTTASGPYLPVHPLKMDPTRRYLVDQNNLPFLMVGDSPQTLFVKLSEGEVETYFANRQALGFNTVWVNLLCNQGTQCDSSGRTFDGIAPFTVPGNLATPNEAYFSRMDRMLTLAARYNLLVILDPIETIGWLDTLISNGVTKDRAFGRYLGNRYKNFDNILWMSGNDFGNWSDADADAVVHAVALGILDNDARHLHTVELYYDTSGSLDDPSWAPIISLDAAYTYYATYAQVLIEYNRPDHVPVFMVEANYEFEQNCSCFDAGNASTLRRQEYWTMLSGATGQLYGSAYTWAFPSDWETNLNTPGAIQFGYLRTLFSSRRWYDLVPDQAHTVVTAGYGTYIFTSPFGDNNYVTAGATPDGALVMAYVPQSQTVTVDMTKLAGQVTAQWFDPSNGTYRPIAGSPFANTGSRLFTHPGANSSDDVDWVLVLEATLVPALQPPSSPPAPATPVSPSGSIATTTPAFSWTADGSAAYYALSVSDASAGSSTIAWYTPAQAGCPLGGTCAVTAPKSLASGLITWAVITWNPFGYGPWSATKSAVVDFADAALRAPEPGGPLGPIATRTPTYTWQAVSDATWYQLSITDAHLVVREFWYSPSQACVSATCAVTPNALLAIGAAQWKVRAWQASGSGAWTAPVLFEAADSAPGTATLVSPLGPVTTVTPSFTWNAVPGTSYYLLRVTNRDQVTVDRWYLPAAAGCPSGTGTCTASPGISLTAGAATWSVLTWNGSGYGPWSATREFLVEIADPAAVAPAAVSPTEAIVSSNATYRWTAVTGALSYRLSIGNNGGAPVYWWVTAAAAGCDAGGECSTSPEVALLNDTAQWRVQAWTTIGYGSWSPVVTVTVNIPAPPAPTLVSPDGAAGSPSPAFRWNASANATLYYIRAYDPTGLRVDKWFTPSQVGCVSGGVCTLNPGVTLASGAGSWQVIAWNPTGYSPWSSTLAFVVP